MRSPELIYGLVLAGAAALAAFALAPRCSLTLNEQGKGDVAVSMQIGAHGAVVRATPERSGCPPGDERLRFTIDRQALEILFERPETESARMIPLTRESDLAAIRLESIDASSAFAVLGLENGDTISCVDGVPLYDTIRSGSVPRTGATFSVHVIRGNRVLEMSYDIRGYLFAHKTGRDHPAYDPE